MRSAKTKAMTPPKEMPPCHKAAASGTLPTEQTQLTTAISGPTMAFSRVVQGPCPRTKTSLHHDVGTVTAKKPATT